MRQFTTPEQTAKLIELGFEPSTRIPFEVGNDELGRTFSIGELIETLEEVASVVISYSYQKRGYYVRVITPKRIGGLMYRIRQIELVDALYDMCVKLKEEGMI